MRLRRADPGRSGWTRRRRGRSFSYHDQTGAVITDPEELRRIRGLVIPPAWQDVWISPHARGHIQATGTDAAGRRQYLYHPEWRRKRDEAKFDHMLDVARRLPKLRQAVSDDLDGRGLSERRVLAALAKLLDLGFFRIGSDQYANGDDPSYGLSTLRPEHLRGSRGCLVVEFTGKAGVVHSRPIGDPQVCAILRSLRRRRRGDERLFAYWTGRAWRDVHADDINAYLREVSGGEMTAKDFRTWHGTVAAATGLAAAGWHRSVTKRRRAVVAVIRDVAELLGNTPAVAKASYVDPGVVDLYHSGTVAHTEEEVLEMLS